MLPCLKLTRVDTNAVVMLPTEEITRTGERLTVSQSAELLAGSINQCIVLAERLKAQAVIELQSRPGSVLVPRDIKTNGNLEP